MSIDEIAARIKKARKDAHMTQAEAAAHLGITYQAISNYERGVTRIDTDTLVKLCSIYNVPLSDILGTKTTPAQLLGWDETESALVAGGWSIESIAEEMNVSVDRISEVISASGVDSYSYAFLGKVFQVARALINISSRNAANVNIVKIAGRDGSYTEKHLTDDQLKALKLIIDQMPDAEDI